MSGTVHHPKCFQVRGVPSDLPNDVCDCRILWMLAGAVAVEAGGTCPSQCAALNHPGREHEEWFAERTAATHTRTETDCGPDFCHECSDAAQEWVPWPCAGAPSASDADPA